LKQEGERYLVRWATHHVDEATWEQQSSLPAFIADWVRGGSQQAWYRHSTAKHQMEQGV
jgi:hypothetical protein